MAILELTTTAPSIDRISDYADLGNGIIVHRYNIIGTPFVHYAVYRKIAGAQMDEYSSFTHHEQYGWLGDVCTHRPAPELLAMPYNRERADAVYAHYDAQIAEATALALQAFPADFA